MPSKAKQAQESRYTRPELRERLKEQIKASDKGGKPGQWSARKSQLLATEYKHAGGGYRGPKGPEAKSLEHWTEEEWQTRDGSTRARKPGGTTARYLPKKAWEQLPEPERKATDRKKRRASRAGKQFVPNTPAAAQARRKAVDAVEGASAGRRRRPAGKSPRKTPSRPRRRAPARR